MAMVNSPPASRRPVAPSARSAKKRRRERKSAERGANGGKTQGHGNLTHGQARFAATPSPAFRAPGAARQNGTDRSIPTRRAVLGGAFAASAWRLGARARADAPASAAAGRSQLRGRAGDAPAGPAPGRTGGGVRLWRLDSGAAPPAQERRGAAAQARQRARRADHPEFSGPARGQRRRRRRRPHPGPR